MPGIVGRVGKKCNRGCELESMIQPALHREDYRVVRQQDAMRHELSIA